MKYQQYVSPTDIIILLITMFFILTNINAPNILVGYGLIIPAMMIPILFTNPIKGAALFFIAHSISTGMLIYTKSMFMVITLASLIVRSSIVLTFAYFLEKERIKNIPFILTSMVIIDTLISLSIGLLYFGHDAIEVGLDVYSIIYIPYIYLSHRYYKERKIMYTLILILGMILYYFSAAYFYALPLNLLSILILLLLIKKLGYENRWRLLGIFLIGFLVLTPLSTPAINYNFKIITYPLQPSTSMGKQWIQTSQNQNCKQGNVFEDVWDPSRLRILDKCVTIKGIVVSEPSTAEDGDIFFDLKLDPEYNHMLSTGSLVLRGGVIHVEIVPADQSTVIPPKKGDYVTVTGVWVVDTDHGSWSEIHPAIKITSV